MKISHSFVHTQCFASDAEMFLGDHFGGSQSILLYACRDSTQEFNMMHKHNIIREVRYQAGHGEVRSQADVGKRKNGQA
jgi:cytochrome b involved in lipid metabolism